MLHTVCYGDFVFWIHPIIVRVQALKEILLIQIFCRDQIENSQELYRSLADWHFPLPTKKTMKTNKNPKEITYFCLKLMGRENVKWPIQLHLPAPVLPSILPPSVSYDSRFPMAYCLWKIATFSCLFFSSPPLLFLKSLSVQLQLVSAFSSSLFM